MKKVSNTLLVDSSELKPVNGRGLAIYIPEGNMPFVESLPQGKILKSDGLSKPWCDYTIAMDEVREYVSLAGDKIVERRFDVKPINVELAISLISNRLSGLWYPHHYNDENVGVIKIGLVEESLADILPISEIIITEDYIKVITNEVLYSHGSKGYHKAFSVNSAWDFVEYCNLRYRK